VAGRVRFLGGDLFAPVPSGEVFDFVLSNPPYIARADLERLPVGVRYYEPQIALDGGPEGYTVLDRLIEGARARLRAGGHLIVEIGAPQEKSVRQRLEAMAGYELADTIHDYSGHPRVLRARWKG
jgi:release factor glutamine methyltransferase